MGWVSYSEEHGGIDPQELIRLKISAAGLIDFSVNSNPFGPSERVVQAIREVNVSSYPDRECYELRQRLAEANRVTPDEILVGNGVAELIWLIAHAFLRPGETVLIVGPTFGEYGRAARALGAQVLELRACEPDFIPPVEDVITAIRRVKPRLAFVCNPNNPTGRYLLPDQLGAILSAGGEETVWVLDEAYRAFVDGNFFGPPQSRNCLTLRSMTKDFALAGIRLGYVLADQARIQRLKQFQPAWSVNATAQAAGLAVLENLPAYQLSMGALRQLSGQFFAQLRAIGLEIAPSDTHFTIFRTGWPAPEIRTWLLRERIQVRDCTSFGLPDYIRVSTQLQAANDALIQSLGAILAD
jgi:histidinol-phosphate aminotransferase